MSFRIFIVAVVVAFAAGAFLSDFYVSVLNYVALYALVTLGVVLLTGVAGITSFGQAAFVGIGAYASAVVSAKFGVSPWLGLCLGLALTAASALIIGWVTLRLSGHYLPLGTIAWGVSLYYLLGNIASFGGHTGLTGIPAISIAGYSLDTGRKMYFLIWAVLLVAMALMANMLDSRPGRAIRALKTAAGTAESFGVDTTRTKMLVFLYAALLASISGWLYAHLLRFVNPTPFSLTMGIEYLFMAVIGGAGSVWGALVGAGIITVLKEYLQVVLPQWIGRSGNYEIIVFGGLIILLLQFNRERGLTALLSGWFRRIPASEPSASATALTRRAGNSQSPVAEVCGVRKQFGGLTAISDLSFEIRRAELLALIGPNGAGKTTLFNILSGALPSNGGSITFNGETITGLPPHAIARKGVARTFQHVQIVKGMSVLENTMLGAHNRASHGTIAAALKLNKQEEADLRGEALRALERVGLANAAHEMAESLALGQQRILEIARALCADPELLLLDEPAAGLRYAEKQSLAELLNGLKNQGMSILLVEHDMEFVMNLADRIVVMNFGQKLSEGVPAAIRNDDRVIEAYLGADVA